MDPEGGRLPVYLAHRYKTLRIPGTWTCQLVLHAYFVDGFTQIYKARLSPSGEGALNKDKDKGLKNGGGPKLVCRGLHLDG